MISRVAIKQGGKVFSKPVGYSHHDVMNHMYAVDVSPEDSAEFGFLTDNGTFLDRRQAAKHAHACGQVVDENCISLNSFDLRRMT